MRSVVVSRIRLFAGLLLSVGLACAQPPAPRITPSKDIIGFAIGDDYHMANYTQLTALWKKWETESNRMKVVSIGTTAEGRPQLMAIISSPENLKNLEHFRQISLKLAHADGLSEEDAHRLAKEGKAVVWIDGGLHSSESVNSQQLIQTVYEYLSRNDDEALRFLNDVILLAPVANPDGVEIMANWYMHLPDEKQRTFAGVPQLYNKYVGHDNNRDSIMNNMPETTNQNRVLFIDWIPQIMYNHHQPGPEGQVIFIAPFRDPFNYNFDPLVPLGVEEVGIAMHARLVAHGMGGSAMRSAAPYSTWWNGGMRTAVYFHNQIGILSEVIGSPTPSNITLVPSKQLPTGDWPMPIAPQVWHYRQSISYDVEVNWAALDYASRNRETLLFNMYRMGKNAIDRGNRDSWTITPKRITALYAAANMKEPSASDSLASFFESHAVPTELYEKVLHAPDQRDARGYIISADQDDFPTAVKFVNVLLKQGVTVQKATAAFAVAGKNYPSGSYVVKAAQAFRAEVMDMFEPQDHPNDFLFPGGPPRPPYDITGWTPAVQMGVKFDRLQEGFDGPFTTLSFELEKPAPATVAGPANPAGYMVSHKMNDSFILTNRLLKAGCEVDWIKDAQTENGRDLGTGTLWIPANPKATPIIARAAAELGVPAYAVAQKPAGDMMKLKPVRIGLLDVYGGSMPSGWLRWMLEQYEFPFEVVFPPILDAGDLRKNFDVIVFPSDTYGEGGRNLASAAAIERFLTFNAGTAMSGTGAMQYNPPASQVPEEFRSMLGTVTNTKSVPPLKTFVEEGGTIIAVGSSSRIGQALGIPVKNHLMETVNGKEVPVAREKYYVPGSVLHARFDNTNPVAYGMPADGFVFFDNNPVLQIAENSSPHTVPITWFNSKTPLYSGWAWGQAYLDGGQVATESDIGAGKVVLLAFEPTFRGTPHSTFKLFFNSLFFGSTTAAPAR